MESSAARVRRELAAARRRGAVSNAAAELVAAFLAARGEGTRLKDLALFRRFAEHAGRPPEDWPAALEALVATPPASARERVESFSRRCATDPRSRAAGPRHRRSFTLHGFLAFCRAQGAIAWSPPTWPGRKSEAAWNGVDPGFRALAIGWLGRLRYRAYAPYTLRQIACSLRAFGRHLAERRVRLADFATAHALAWLGWVRANRRWSEATRPGVAWHARSFCRWLVEEGFLKADPFQAVGPLKFDPRPLPRVLSPRQVRRLLREARAPRDRALVEFLYATGCRVGELASLDLADVDLSRRTARCVGKRGRERMLLLNRAAARALRAYLRQSGSRGARAPRRAGASPKPGPSPIRPATYETPNTKRDRPLFLNASGRRISRATVEARVRALARAAGLPARTTPHVLRHSFATHLADRGAGLHALMRLLGHSHVASTLPYLHVATRRLGEIHRRCHPRR